MRFGVLGPLAVWAADGTPVVVAEVKVRAVLAGLLVDPGRVVSADRLVQDVWGAEPPANPTGALQTRVSRLRKALAQAGGRELVVHRPPGYLLRVADDAVDAGRFAALTAQARGAGTPRDRAALLTEALGLWRGPAFADFADEPFSRAAITRLEEQRLLALEEQAEARIELGEHSLLAGELGDLVERHPLRERLRAAQMRALYGAGRASEALDSYQVLRRRLDEELGLEPGPELVALQQKILRQDPTLKASNLKASPLTDSPLTDSTLTDSTLNSSTLTAATAPAPEPAAPRPRTNLPTPVTDLIGRSRSVAEVRELLSAARLVTLTGPGGVGKTRLAVECATRAAESFPDGAWLVELAGRPRPAASASSVDALAEVVAATLGIRDDTRPGQLPDGRPLTLLDRLADALRGKRLLLVLDNCEHVVEPAARLAQELLSAVPGVRILATSQEPLDISGEQVWSVPPLDLPEPTAAPDSVRRSGAVQLFAARATAASPGFALTDDNAQAVAAICRRLDGIPLALELASSRVRVLGVPELAERLDDRFRLLTGGHRGAPARQQTLRAMIDWSWELLTAAEQIVLRRLAIHSDGCTLEAAETVCSGDGVRPDQVVDLLARLVDRSLVLATHGADGPRYRLLESVAAYCTERLRDTGADHDRVRRAHARYYATLAEHADSQLRGGDQQRWLRRLDTETANLRGALDTAAADDDLPLARRLVHALAWYWYLSGRLTEAKRSFALALGDGAESGAGSSEASRAGGGAGRDPRVPDPAGIAAWRAALGMASGDRPDSDGGSQAALALYEAVRDPCDRAWTGWFLGLAVTKFGDLAVGEELSERALATFRELGDSWGVAAALSNRAEQLYTRGELTASRRAAEDSLALFGEAGDRWGQLRAMAVLGTLAEISGDYPRAAEWRREGLCVAEDLGLWTEASLRWSELGRIALLTGDHERADSYHERARRLAVEHSDRPAEEFAEVGLALGARRRGRLDVAERYLRTWLEWNHRFTATNGSALILAELGFVAELRGDAESALSLHRRGLAAARDTGDPRAVALALEGLAGARALAGEHADAARLLGAAA
ncbi:BTAD domain-containing putative transcriptional regulator, partial [Streptomyces sp. E11-3]|uniref:BTAD domain-containing putative transcriptional regulator n=1 Tax=Streptomyces sp. E11-3 TaxID=3110112 RepID=UPI00397F66A3